MNERLREATKDMGRAIVRLRLEGELDLVDSCTRIRGLWFEYEALLRSTHQRRYGQIAEALTKLQGEFEVITDQTRSNLESLSRPI